ETADRLRDVRRRAGRIEELFVASAGGYASAVLMARSVDPSARPASVAADVIRAGTRGPDGESARRSAGFSLLDLVVSIRPAQWPKNLFVFFGLIFGEKLFEPAAFERALATFGIFCALSGAVYLVNDIRDRDADRRH